MVSGLKASLRPLARRVALTRKLDGLIALLALPYIRSAGGVNPVVGDYYGMVVGQRFADDEEAARHYFSRGWRLGVVPTPFLNVPRARVSTAAALLVRNELARAARGAAPRPRWVGAPARTLDGVDARGLLNGSHSGGWFGNLMSWVAHDPGALNMRIGVHSVPWETYLRSCRELTEATNKVVSENLIDLEFYQSQIGGYRFLSVHAALEDYVARGEVDGRTPSPFFEGEWYEAFDRSQVRRGRPANLFLDYIAKGELAQASPHFWGKRYLEEHLAGEAPPSLLGHFASHARPDSPTPSSEGIEPVTRGEAERISRERVAAYHAGLGLLVADGGILPRHPAARPARGDGSCLVVVDERHLRSASAVAALSRSIGQSLRGVRLVVVESDDVPTITPLQELLDSNLVADAVSREPGESLGAVTLRLIEESGADAWTIWTPRQRWEPTYLASAVGALREDATVSAAAVVTESTPQPWLRTDEAMWLADLDGEGVVFRASGETRLLPDPSLDLGVAWKALISLSARGKAAVIHAPLVARVTSRDVSAHDRRAGANAARGGILCSFDGSASHDVAVIIPTYEDWRMTLTAVRRVLETTSGRDVGVVVVDNGSRRPVSGILANAFATSKRVRIHRLPLNTDFATGSNIGAALAAAPNTVFLNNDTAVLEGWLDPLLDAIADDTVAAVQPILLYGDRTVQTAGTIFLGGLSMPQHLYADAHVIDVPPSIDDYPFSALTAACLAVRFRDFAAVGGFDAHYVNGMEDVDLCLRLGAHIGAPLRVRRASRVVHFESRTAGRHDHQWANRAWFGQRWRKQLVSELDDRRIFDDGPHELVGIQWDRLNESPLWIPKLMLSPRKRLEISETTPRLRWAIKSSATGDLSGDTWGDTFFADALAEALQRLGQDVVVDRASSHGRGTAQWDDVTLALRGLARYIPQPGAINLLWVISHPDLVTRAELESGYARVFSAGAAWAEEIRRRWGIDVGVLLQATDVTKFHPDAADGRPRGGTLFVGRTRGVSRPIVTDVIAAGGDPHVYGDDGWEQFIDPRFVRGSGIPNEAVPEAYASAGIVLNDHWRDMADFGFYSNRLFDAAATGARIISDPVDGLDDIFGAQVRTYSDLDELRTLLDPDAPVWPSDRELRESAGRIAQNHSFDVRAATLLDEALRIRAERRG